MKTTEDWIFKYDMARETVPQLISQIQIDALKEGMRRAANVITPYDIGVMVRNGETADILEQAILTAAEQLTEKDLI